LSRMVIGPAATLLGNHRLLVVADGALQYVPFAALPAPPAPASSVNDKRQMTKVESRPLIADHEIVNLPSASALAVLRRELDGRKPAEKAVAVIADPVFSADDERLKYARHRDGAPPVKVTSQAGVTTQTRDFERAVDEAGLTRDGLSLARLSFSRREAEAIFAAVPAGQGLKAVDFDASRATAIGADLSRYRIVHFATHGLLNP